MLLYLNKCHDFYSTQGNHFYEEEKLSKSFFRNLSKSVSAENLLSFVHHNSKNDKSQKICPLFLSYIETIYPSEFSIVLVDQSGQCLKVSASNILYILEMVVLYVQYSGFIPPLFMKGALLPS